MSKKQRFTIQLLVNQVRGREMRVRKRGLSTRSYLAVVAVMAMGAAYSGVGWGEDASTTLSAPAASGGTTMESVTPAGPPKSKFFGTIDLRAEYYPNNAAYDTSNFLQLGYQINPKLLISWYQGFDTNIDHTLLYGQKAYGLNAIWDQGFLRTRVNKIWESEDKTLSFNYESRVYAPTLFADASAGNITRFYNAFKLIKKANDALTFTGVLVLMPDIFGVPGTAAFGPNPAYENRYYFVTDIQFSQKWSLDFPILLYQTKYREYGTTAQSGAWNYLLYIWPELDYAVTDNFTLGLAYISGNMVKPDFSGFTIGDAFKVSTVQFVFTTTL